MILPQLKVKDLQQIDSARYMRFMQNQIAVMLQLNNPKKLAMAQPSKYIELKDSSKLTQSLVVSKGAKSSDQKKVVLLPTLIQNYYIYYLGTGNNHQVVQRVLSKRNEWMFTTNKNDSSINFRWSLYSKGYQYDKLVSGNKVKQAVNHFEFHSEISQKSYLFKNLQHYCEENQIDIMTFVPLTFVLDFTNEKADMSLLQFLQYYESNAPSSIKLNDTQNKFYSIRRYLNTYMQITDKFVQINKSKIPSTFLGNDYLWILKPTQYNCGRGIHVIKDLDQMAHLLNQYITGKQQKKDGKIIRSKQIVIQKYLEKPLLINNRKFDIRVWGLLNSDLEFFFFEQGYIRMASEEYTTKDVQNQYVHLTNNAIQKQSPNYGKLEDGNQLSFDQAAAYFKSKGDFYKLIVENIKQISLRAFQSTRKKINFFGRRYCFEIFGLDYMIDDDFKVWLIEINSNPCLEESSQLLQGLIPRMLDDAFSLTLDHLFPVTKKQIVFSVPNYSDNHNMWQWLGNLF
ncbi:unnamed protein product (macronuclear) [Paramecium tetraurelia]|uniref:Tubulin-tyrosine ligase family protein n=1 Tax=Paramecium tetraurelia TaxID=5888 RepID=A0BRQ6_PARTE|nr:uncharacterized protein GSPATT00031454001 [Paramecium tetraurelia]CAK61223.1 unnamed protein product [Paramecium tetraurelia]|eukprot:XP_001428621.1 hypothetical protein (macronuclear) [Paramecium tetraurelia strain d4-2]